MGWFGRVMTSVSLNISCVFGVVALAGAIVAGCAAHMTSALTVDGNAFVPTSCTSGQRYGFQGVELVDEQGRRLRLARAFDGRFQSAYFPAGSPTADYVTDCGTLDVQGQTGTANGIRNVMGSASLRCKTVHHELVGGVSFDHCH